MGSNAGRVQEQGASGFQDFGPKLKRILIGGPKDPTDPHVFHKLSLVAFLAWVGLGADGLSSSAYGPDEAFRAILGHEYLALYLGALTAFTVVLISYSYTKVVEHFPTGGGGYVVATKLLGPVPGVVSGAALVVDYILTITVSVCSGVDAILSFLPLPWQAYKVPLDLFFLLLLLVLNLRGVKESVKALLPIFLVFVATHVLLIVYGIMAHAHVLPEVVTQGHRALQRDASALGWWVLALIFLRAYSLGGGTYTGIEAVSNGLPVLRDPKPQTAKRTMALMASSLAFTAAGIFVCYLLWHASPEAGKTMNAVLLDRVFSPWQVGGWPIGRWLVILTLISEGALLFVAAQAGFVDGPRVLSNMALDSWVPHSFAHLSERLVTKNGIFLMSLAAGVLMIYTRGRVSFLVVLYSINVFLTFSLTQLGMSRMWIKERRALGRWGRNLAVNLTSLVLCVSILVITTVEKFKEGGWLTFAITTSFILLCVLVRRHYFSVRKQITDLNKVFEELPIAQHAPSGEAVDRSKPTAVLLVSGYSGLGIHSLLSVQKLFPGYFKDYVFISVSVVDSAHFKEKAEVEQLLARTQADLKRYVELANKLGLRADSRMTVGTDVVHESEELCKDVGRDYPRAVFFLGKLVFAQEKFFYRFLHNDTAFAIQRRLQFSGLQTVVLPIRMRLEGT
jgi:amino acid transporter